MSPLDTVKLAPLMRRTSGQPDIVIGLLDGPVMMSHPDLAAKNIRGLAASSPGACSDATSAACAHGTFVAGILAAKRTSAAPAICPGCTVLVRPIYAEGASGDGSVPSVTPEELASAIIQCIHAGVRIINLSSAFARPSSTGERELEEALNHAAQRGVLIVAAAGNQGTLGGSAIIRHPWVIPVAACDVQGRPMRQSTFGHSIGRRGLRAPGDAVTSLGPTGQSPIWGGTSVAAPFVTGTLALLWSAFPSISATELRLVVTGATVARRTSVVPPLLDASAAYQAMQSSVRGRR